jgi:hypothetical protein
MKKTSIDKPQEYLDLIAKNKDNYLYNDHPSDGIDLFCDDAIETIGWHACTFDFLQYRDLAKFMEDNCDGELVFNDHPMGFNAYAIIDDATKTAQQLKEFCIDKITKENIPIDELDDDQKEALKFFELKV